MSDDDIIHEWSRIVPENGENMSFERLRSCYSDDEIYLRNLVELATVDPLVERSKRLWIPFICRQYIISFVGRIELILNYLREEDSSFCDDVVSKLPESNISSWADLSNETKFTAIFQTFENRGVPVSEEVKNTYLSIKRLRNAYLHADKDFSSKKRKVTGFPADFNEFNKTHLKQLISVDRTLRWYFLEGKTKWKSRSPQPTRNFDRVETDDGGVRLELSEDEALRVEAKLWSEQNFIRARWENLERLAESMTQKKDLEMSLIQQTWKDWESFWRGLKTQGDFSDKEFEDVYTFIKDSKLQNSSCSSETGQSTKIGKILNYYMRGLGPLKMFGRILPGQYPQEAARNKTIVRQVVRAYSVWLRFSGHWEAKNWDLESIRNALDKRFKALL